jgi:hypothetical protein
MTTSALPAPVGPAPRPRGPVLRRCACGGQSAPGGECQECRKKRLQRSASASAPSPGTAPAAVHEALRSPGEPLDAPTRAFMEPRFGHSFADVRVHADAAAARSASAVGARAYAVGRDVVFGAGMYAPARTDGRRLIAHELAHVVQQSGTSPAAPSPSLEVGPVDAPEEREADSVAERVVSAAPDPRAGRWSGGSGGAPRLMRDADPAAGATYPTVDQRAQIQGILNPQGAAAAASGGSVPAVDSASQFRTDIESDVSGYITQALPPAQARQTSPVALALPAVQDLADVAQARVQSFFGSYLQAATHTPVEASRRAGLQLRSEAHLVSQFPGGFDNVACNWVASRMGTVQGGRAISGHNVLASSEAAKQNCPISCPPSGAPAAQPGALRDQALFDQSHAEILCNHLSDVMTIVQFGPSFERPGEVYIQSQLAQRPNEAAADTQRRGRWDTLGSLIHEMLHDVAHERFRDAADGLEESGLAVEGFAEFFTREVHDDLRSRAAGDAALRTSIEGVAAPYSSSVAGQRTGGLYQRGVNAANSIIGIVGGNEQNLRAAFFLGRVEMLGLGGWNEADARRREALRHPANELGVGAALLQGSGGLFDVRYSRVLLGRGGRFQLTLSGDINYLTDGSRLGAGAGVGVRYQWPNFFVQGGAGLGVSGSVGQPLEQTIRLDVIPELRAGVRIGIVRIGAGALLVIPAAGGPVSDRTVRLGGLLGVSLDL